MSNNQWNKVDHYFEYDAKSGDLFIMSALSMVYRDFSFAEGNFDATPWEEELTDDLKDHCRTKEYKGKQTGVIMRLLQNTPYRFIQQ